MEGVNMEESREQIKPEKGFSFVELPSGIFTADGVWFHTSEALLREFAPEVVDRKGVRSLLQDATLWARLPVTLATYSVLLFMLMVPLYPALVAALLVYLVMSVLTPSVVLPKSLGLVRVISHPIVQGLLYVAVLSFLARIGHVNAVWAGLAAFMLLRWGIIDKIFAPLISRMPGMQSPLSIPDRVLRALIVRHALTEGTPTQELMKMEEEMLRIMQYRKNRR